MSDTRHPIPGMDMQRPETARPTNCPLAPGEIVFVDSFRNDYDGGMYLCSDGEILPIISGTESGGPG